jgi:hypothetical protein
LFIIIIFNCHHNHLCNKVSRIELLTNLANHTHISPIKNWVVASFPLCCSAPVVVLSIAIIISNCKLKWSFLFFCHFFNLFHENVVFVHRPSFHVSPRT